MTQAAEKVNDKEQFPGPYDKTMTVRIGELCRDIEAANIPLTWECLSRVTHVDFELFAQMKRAGCKRIFFGIESGDEGVLKQMQKGITPEQSRTAAVRHRSHAGL